MVHSNGAGSSWRGAALCALALGLGGAVAACGGDDEGVAPDSIIRIDGEMDDWSRAAGVTPLGTDPVGDGRDQYSELAALSPEADLVRVSAAHDADKLYFLLELAGARPSERQIEYAIFIDADGRPASGYPVGDNAIGAEFVVINGLLLAHDSMDRTEWKWKTLDFKVEELESRPEERKLEISVDRRAFQTAGGKGVSTLGLLFSTIEPLDPTQWEDNITDFVPEQNGRPSRVTYRLRQPGPPPPPPAPPRPAVAGVRNYLLYYGGWDRTIIEKVYEYDLLILDAHRGPRASQIAPVVRRIRAGKNGIPGDSDDVLVLGYISLGEDVRTFGLLPAQPGDGRGPASWDQAASKLVFQNQGIASFYLDEKLGADEVYGRDGLPDRQGTWGGCFVNPGDPAWQNFLVGQDGRLETPYSVHVLLDRLGYQGLFLDTPEVADPWHGYGYTSEGMYGAIARIRASYPGAVLLLNRGVFFFVPQFPVQFQWNPRKLIDIGLFESHYLDSDYGENAELPYHLSPYFVGNTVFYDQKIQAELGRTDDSFELMLSLDYAADPDHLARDYPDIYRDAIASSLLEYGRVPLITTRLVDATPTLTLHEPPAPDEAPPRWGNTTVGFSELAQVKPPAFVTAGNEDRKAKPPRVGAQKAIPGDRRVTLRWDVALDQSLPVHYNVYVSDRWPFDLASARALPDVTTSIGGDYVARSLTSADDGCPYEHTVTGLDNDKTYYFVVRAQDRLGHEDDNLAVLAATPRAAGAARPPIVIDGAFEDWEAVPAVADRAGETAGATLDWIRARWSEDADAFYLCYETASAPGPSTGQRVFINSDGASWTGLHPRGGADFMVSGRQLYRYTGDGTMEKWTLVAQIDLAQQDTRIEMKLPRAALAATGEGPTFTLVGPGTAATADTFPDSGAGVFLSR